MSCAWDRCGCGSMEQKAKSLRRLFRPVTMFNPRRRSGEVRERKTGSRGEVPSGVWAPLSDQLLSVTKESSSLTVGPFFVSFRLIIGWHLTDVRTISHPQIRDTLNRISATMVGQKWTDRGRRSSGHCLRPTCILPPLPRP